MIGILLAIALTTTCATTGADVTAITLRCNDAQRSELIIPRTEWPHEWREPRIGNVYQLNPQGQAIESEEDLAARAEARKKMLKEMKRWRIPALQQKDVDQ